MLVEIKVQSGTQRSSLHFDYAGGTFEEILLDMPRLKRVLMNDGQPTWKFVGLTPEQIIQLMQ